MDGEKKKIVVLVKVEEEDSDTERDERGNIWKRIVLRDDPFAQLILRGWRTKGIPFRVKRSEAATLVS